MNLDECERDERKSGRARVVVYRPGDQSDRLYHCETRAGVTLFPMKIDEDGSLYIAGRQKIEQPWKVEIEFVTTERQSP